MSRLAAAIRRWKALTAATALLLGACDQTFEPLGENESPFSMFSILNATADTQWVRVMPIRESVFSGPAPIDATVMLLHHESGKVVELRDSLFAYESFDPDVTATLYAHNFWTAEPLVRGGTYTVRATRSDGGSVSATVRVPLEVRRVSVSIDRNPHATRDGLTVQTDGHIALLNVLHGFGDGAIAQRQSLRALIGAGSLSIYRHMHLLGDKAFLPPLPPRPMVCAQDRFCTISMVISGEPWPFKEDFSEAYVTLEEAISNVEGGPGFVGAVFVHEVPYEACTIPPPSNVNCQLIYDETTSTLLGTVRDVKCDVPLPDAWVVLRRSDRSRTRTTRAQSDGSFRIGAIEAGVPHDIFISELVGHVSTPRTMSFTAGDTMSVTVGVERIGECPDE